jgi:hypothetical protein
MGCNPHRIYKGNNMKVSELIAELECYHADSEVHFAYGAGDYWSTVLAPKVTRTFQGIVLESEYHNTFKLVDDEDVHEDEGDEPLRVVIIE